MINFTNFINAMTEAAYMKSITTAIIVTLTEFFGKDWWIIRMLIILIFVDTVLGIFSAIRFQHKLSSEKLHGGVIKMMAYSLAIILVWIVQEISLRTIPFELPILAFFAGYQSLTEIKSISNHLERNGLIMPSLFHRLTNTVENKMNEELEHSSNSKITHNKIKNNEDDLED
jgi:toxin secretion/phage lysis holin